MAKSFIAITLNCFRSLVAVRMAEEGTDYVLYLLAKNHVLVGIVDEVLKTLNLLQMDLGALEGQTREDYFLNSIFYPSVNQCSVESKLKSGNKELLRAVCQVRQPNDRGAKMAINRDQQN